MKKIILIVAFKFLWKGFLKYPPVVVFYGTQIQTCTWQVCMKPSVITRPCTGCCPEQGCCHPGVCSLVGRLTSFYWSWFRDQPGGLNTSGQGIRDLFSSVGDLLTMTHKQPLWLCTCSANAKNPRRKLLDINMSWVTLQWSGWPTAWISSLGWIRVSKPQANTFPEELAFLFWKLLKGEAINHPLGTSHHQPNSTLSEGKEKQ